MRKASLTVLLTAGMLVVGLVSTIPPAWGTEVFLTRDLGIHGISHLCQYSNGKVYAFNATQLCPLQLGSQESPSTAGSADSDGDISLFNSAGSAVAYVDTGDGMTIYLWGGQPVAYLDADGSGGYNVYGFNGEHLGWFINGVIWGHSGYAACATKERMTETRMEPLKGLQQLKPLKSLEQLAPLEPLLTNSFGDTSCKSLLESGAN